MRGRCVRVPVVQWCVAAVLVCMCVRFTRYQGAHNMTREEEGKKENRDAPCIGLDPIDRILPLRVPPYVIVLGEKKETLAN